MERNERLKAADKCASKYTDKNEARIARAAFMLGCEFEAQGEAIKGVNLESEKPMNQDELEKVVADYFEGYWPGMETAEQCNTDLRFTPPAIMRLARHFADWGAEHLKK